MTQDNNTKTISITADPFILTIAACSLRKAADLEEETSNRNNEPENYRRRCAYIAKELRLIADTIYPDRSQQGGG